MGTYISGLEQVKSSTLPLGPPLEGGAPLQSQRPILLRAVLSGAGAGNSATTVGSRYHTTLEGVAQSAHHFN